MNVRDLSAKIVTRFRTELACSFYRRRLMMRNSVPVISFTFDDFPRSALQVGGDILKSYGVRGTYYGALGLIGMQTEVGELFTRDDLDCLLFDGHELGCHTFGHLDPWSETPSRFEASILRNASTASELLGGHRFRTFSYPLFYPRPLVKRRVADHFSCCRCGGQTFNSGIADVNLLAGYFIERGREREIQRLIDLNSARNGWLIFATHDIADKPSPYGCTRELLDGIVRYAARSGARILPVIQAYEAIFCPNPG